jgi:hypothetical protein
MNLEEAKAAFPPIFAIYRNPRDFPNRIVVRAWYGNVPSPVELVLDSVDDARAILRGLFCMGRSENDDPAILESWV